MINECSKVKEKLQEYYDVGYDKTSQVVAFVGDRKIVDLFGDTFNNGYNEDSLVFIASNGKTIGAILMAMMVDQGLLDWQAPVTKYWPEFGKNGKDILKVVDVMRHQAGLPIISEKIDLTLLTTENIKQNKMGEILENETFIWFTKEKRDNPT